MEEFIKQWFIIKQENENCISLNNYLANCISVNYAIEKRFLPVFVDGKKIQFTNIGFNSNGSGDDYFLIIENNKYKFLKYGYESDCDGGYYFYCTCNLFNPLNYDYTPLKELSTNDILNVLKNFNQLIN